MLNLRGGDTHEVVVEGPDGVVFEGGFELADLPFGDRYAGLYVVGPGDRFAIITARYGPQFSAVAPQPRLIDPPPGELFDLPVEIETAGIDEPFLDRVSVSGDDETEELIHLCTWDPSSRGNGCDDGL